MFVPPSIVLFQSTLPMQGATSLSDRELSEYAHFNPRSQCRERPMSFDLIALSETISIHAPNAGSD